jgi:hypothetical protein
MAFDLEPRVLIEGFLKWAESSEGVAVQSRLRSLHGGHGYLLRVSSAVDQAAVVRFLERAQDMDHLRKFVHSLLRGQRGPRDFRGTSAEEPCGRTGSLSLMAVYILRDELLGYNEG